MTFILPHASGVADHLVRVGKRTVFRQHESGGDHRVELAFECKAGPSGAFGRTATHTDAMSMPNRAQSAIVSYNRHRGTRFVSMDELARDLGLGARPRSDALEWMTGVLQAAEEADSQFG